MGTIYEVKEEDLTHLGGPMGSEYTTTNWRKTFIDMEKAWVFFNKKIEETGQKPMNFPLKGKGGSFYRDCLSVGYGFKTIETED